MTELWPDFRRKTGDYYVKRATGPYNSLLRTSPYNLEMPVPERMGKRISSIDFRDGKKVQAGLKRGRPLPGSRL